MLEKYFSKLNKIKNNYSLKNGGYTLLETMVAISLFLVVITAGMSSLLNANVLHQKSQDMRSIMDNLSFIMEDISRNMRTGYDYHCFTTGETIPTTPSSVVSTPKSCTSGWAVAFENAFGSDVANGDQWVYKIQSQDGGVTFNIYKSIDGGANWVQLNPNEVVLKSFSGFSVLGAEGISSANQQQPFVNIKLSGSITYKNVITPFSLQSAISQRLIDY